MEIDQKKTGWVKILELTTEQIMTPWVVRQAKSIGDKIQADLEVICRILNS